jgi:tryptophan 2,3-dioxygenase
MPNQATPDACYYADYLRLDRLLDCQAPESLRRGQPAHDEMLFIVVHQAYELWFKQILHELGRIQAELERTPLEDQSLGRIVRGLDRIVEILKLLIQQLGVLETMTPLDFLDFRDLLIPASGFQSVQFRLIEIALGLDRAALHRPGREQIDLRLSDADHARVRAAEAGPKLVDQLDRWLARTPFLKVGRFTFPDVYRAAVERFLAADVARVRRNTAISADKREAEARHIEAELKRLKALFEPAAGPSSWRMSLAAVQAALFIMVYRDEPVLQLPFRLLTALMDIEETLTMWRYRHALMVQRMIGVKVGTGGSSGHDYLRETAERHRIFSDLFQLSTFLIPRSQLPVLPAELKQQLGYVYAVPDK